MATEFPDATSLRITRTMTAEPGRVWEAFTRPDLMASWMWANHQSNTRASCDLRVGGRYDVYTDAPEGEHGWDSDRWGFAGIYVDIVPNERLVYTIHWDGPVGYNQTGDLVLDEVVIVDMRPASDGTEIVMWHLGIPADGVSAPTHAAGIESMFDHLEGLLAA